MVHAADEDAAGRAVEALRSAYVLNDGAPKETPPVLEILR
jgi:hypothetical protein